MTKWINLAECGVQTPHDPHSWRDGFLWHRKHSCKGMTHIEAVAVQDTLRKRKIAESGIYGVHTIEEDHRHKFFLSRYWTTDEELVFICDAHNLGCKVKYRFDRNTFWQSN